jgi:hypothetical protein
LRSAACSAAPSSAHIPVDGLWGAVLEINKFCGRPWGIGRTKSLDVESAAPPRIKIDFIVKNIRVGLKKAKPAAGDIAAGSAILRKAGRFLPETPEGSDVFASVSLTGGRKRQKFERVNAPDEPRRQNNLKKRTTICDFYRNCQK